MGVAVDPTTREGIALSLARRTLAAQLDAAGAARGIGQAEVALERLGPKSPEKSPEPDSKAD